eukprot:13406261-Ditylum_brightwellii.AAC.1
MFHHDRKIYAEQLHNHRGELVFSRRSAQKCLRLDVKEEKHKRMTPSQLCASCPEYQAFQLK